MAAGAPPPSTKVDLVHLLAASRGYRHYLEICTPTTGTTYSSVDQSRFATSMRLMYRCPSDFEDGAPIDFRVPDDDVTPALAEMQRAGARFDVALVDSWHEYAPSWRDIVEVYARMMSGGAMVVHDCLPPVRIMASPFHRDEGWCGLSYKAFLDFVVDRTDLHYCTVDIDYGCGVIWKPPARPSLAERARAFWQRIRGGACPPPRRPTALGDDWRAASSDLERAFDVFEARRPALLQLVHAESFGALLHVE